MQLLLLYIFATLFISILECSPTYTQKKLYCKTPYLVTLEQPYMSEFTVSRDHMDRLTHTIQSCVSALYDVYTRTASLNYVVQKCPCCEVTLDCASTWKGELGIYSCGRERKLRVS